MNAAVLALAMLSPSQPPTPNDPGVLPVGADGKPLKMEQAVAMLKPGGYLLFDHWTWEGHHVQEWFPWELFCDLIPLARGWIGEAGLPVEECPLAGRDPRWWMCLRRSS